MNPNTTRTIMTNTTTELLHRGPPGCCCSASWRDHRRDAVPRSIRRRSSRTRACVGARIEVEGAPDRASPLPGETADVTWLVTSPDATPPLGWAFAVCAPGNRRSTTSPAREPRRSRGSTAPPLRPGSRFPFPPWTSSAAPRASSSTVGSALASIRRPCSIRKAAFRAARTAVAARRCRSSSRCSWETTPTTTPPPIGPSRSTVRRGPPLAAGDDPCVAGTARLGRNQGPRHRQHHRRQRSRALHGRCWAIRRSRRRRARAFRSRSSPPPGKLKSQFSFVEATDEQRRRPPSMSPGRRPRPPRSRRRDWR